MECITAAGRDEVSNCFTVANSCESGMSSIWSIAYGEHERTIDMESERERVDEEEFEKRQKSEVHIERGRSTGEERGEQRRGVVPRSGMTSVQGEREI